MIAIILTLAFTHAAMFLAGRSIGIWKGRADMAGRKR